MKIFVLLSGMLLYLSGPGWGQTSINESQFIRIGDIEQWVTIKGADTSKVAILFLHGGPGSPFTPYADAILEGWENDFVLVHWDQRGAGKTFGSYAPEELDPEFLASHPLTVDQIVNDGIELSEYLQIRLKTEKIILFGTSWGSIIGAKMATKRPDLFYAYIGHSQVVNPSDNNIYNYEKLLHLVQENNDEESLQLLKSIGPPPYDMARNTGKFIQLIKKYERKDSEPWSAAWSEIPSEYNSPQDARHRADGDDYSFLSYAGDSRFGIEPMVTSINLLRDNTQFKIPVYLIQGEKDLLTPEEITREYFDEIKAPTKELIVVPRAAHGLNPAVIDTLQKLLKNKILSEIEQK